MAMKPLAPAIALLLTACASAPTGPSVMVLPGSGKSFEQFEAEDAACRQWAAQQAETTQTATPAQHRYDISYMQCMYAKGNQLPVARSSSAREPQSGPPPTSPAGLPGLRGTGTGNGGDTPRSRGAHRIYGERGQEVGPPRRCRSWSSTRTWSRFRASTSARGRRSHS